MKKLLFILVFAIVSAGMYAQKIEVKETSAPYRSGSKNSLSTIVYHSDLKTVTKEFNSLLKGYKGKVSTKKGEMFGDNLIITSISNNTIDVYATFREGKDGEIEVTAAFDLGGACISQSMHPDQFTRVSDIMREFAIEISEKAYAGFLKEEEKAVKEAEKDYEKMVDTKKDLEKDNEDFKKKISENEKEIENLTKSIEEKGAQLKEKQEAFKKLKNETSKIK
jgi:hypothetical protein